MMKTTKIWKCRACGMVLEEVVSCGNDGTCIPECCGKPLFECKPGVSDGAMEKHVPVFEETSSGVKVSVGSVLHPMTPEHHIVWIEIIVPDGRVFRKYLDQTASPEAFFDFIPEPGSVIREYCNLHGLWIAEVKA